MPRATDSPEFSASNSTETTALKACPHPSPGWKPNWKGGVKHFILISSIIKSSNILQKVEDTVIGRNDVHSSGGFPFFGTGVRLPTQNVLGTIPCAKIIWI
jgi:hypothetical protein